MPEGLKDYCSTGPVWDEMIDPEGMVRPGWASTLDLLKRNGPDEIRRLQRETSRRLKEQGVYYHVYDDPEGIRRTWKLDPLPLLIREEEWQTLEAGIAQRARLQSAFLADIYGSQRSLEAGIVPAEVVLQHPGYLTSLKSAVNQALTMYACDLARGPDGNWWVLDDRTQGPSGAGYVLEARLVTQHVAGDYRGERFPAPLAPFFHDLKRQLAALSPVQNREARIVLLSSGTGNEVYFEHAYLAAQLGITLVEGSDLTVRKGRVFLKTVDDLRQVDVILRRVDDEWCDPLLLRPESMLGVPGLLQAQKTGRVGMANPIGSSVLESPALLPFMPALARFFLSEELLLPGAASWWCGHPHECQQVLDKLDTMIIKSTESQEVLLGGQLTTIEKEALVARIRARPWCFVGQERIGFSTVPTIVGDTLQPRHLSLRVFAVGDGKLYDVMPGGLARVSPEVDNFSVSSQRGGSNKDTWILRSRGRHQNMLRLRPAASSRVSSASLTSSAAENLYWLARYNERSESLLRLMRAYVRRLENPYDFGFESKLEVLKALRPMLATFFPVDESRLLWMDGMKALVLNGERPGSVSWNLNCSISSAYRLRDLWSGDCWRIIEELEELLVYSEKNWSLSSFGQFTQPFLIALLGFSGAVKESISQGQGGIWLQLGRRIERAHNVVLIIQLALKEIAHDESAALREMLLESNDCLNAHRRQYGTEYSYQNVWHHLLLSPDNPRSLQHALDQIEPSLVALKRVNGADLSALQKNLLRVQASVRLADARDWRTGERSLSELAPFLKNLGEGLQALGSALENTYFKHVGTISRTR